MSSAGTTIAREMIRNGIRHRPPVSGRGEGNIPQVESGEQVEVLGETSRKGFLKAADPNNLACPHQDRTSDGKVSRFNTFVGRED